MRVGMLLLLCCVFPVNAGAEGQRVQLLHEVRTRSHLLCSSALLYFSSALRSPDTRVLASSYDSLNLLATRTVQLEQPETMVEALGDMQRLFRALERMPRQDAGRYPELLMQLLQAQRAMDDWAAEQLLQQAEEVDAGLRVLHQQSLEMARLLLDYQASRYPFAAGRYQRLSMDQRQTLDRDISERFVRLTGNAQLATGLAEVYRNYRFVRAQFLANDVQNPSGGIEFYLARSIIDLDELAAQTVAQSSNP